MLQSTLSAPSFASRGLRFGDLACVFVDGRPRPGISLNAIEPGDVEAVEAYTAASDYSRTLSHDWPRGVPCGYTGRPWTHAGRDVVKWLVIWLRH